MLAVFMLAGPGLVMAQTAAAATTAADPEAQSNAMWLGVGYYVLLFLLLCIGVALVGKILKIYDLSLQLQGKKGINWNNIIGAICLLFLAAGLCGAVWSFVVQGNMILPESASKHGVEIDQMFWVTTVIILIVFFITQFLLFTFAFKYRGS
ncbi:MAG: cytochrome c oxidase subunit II, partial [Mucilaginibacter sp.]